MNNIKSTVTVCVPTYNRASSLDRLLQCLLKQAYIDIRIVILDNASADETEEVVGRYKKADSRFEYYRNESNIGPVANFNKVATYVKSDYFMWAADDDLMDEDYIKVCMDSHFGDSDLILVSGRNKLFDNNRLVKVGQSPIFSSSSSFLRVLFYYSIVSDNGFFYGVYKKTEKGVVPLSDVIASDWLYIGEVLFMGKSKVVDGVYLHRSARGCSSNLKELAKSHGLGRFFQFEPNFAAAIEAFKNIISPHSVYSIRGVFYRYVLAALVFISVVLRKVIVQRTYRMLRALISVWKKNV
jgi:glycosyltransferase involved in cell wall biosynthesis